MAVRILRKLLLSLSAGKISDVDYVLKNLTSHSIYGIWGRCPYFSRLLLHMMVSFLFLIVPIFMGWVNSIANFWSKFEEKKLSVPKTDHQGVR